MSRRTTVSALVVAGLCSVAALGQQPADPIAAPKQKEKKTDPADAAVTAALASDPDVLVARAKVQLAEAELAKSRQAVVLKVMMLRATIQEHRSALQAAEERYIWAERMVAKGLMDQRQLADDRAKMEAAKAALARAETELKLLTGGGEPGAGARQEADARAAARAIEWFRTKTQGDGFRLDTAQSLEALTRAIESKAMKGPIPDRIRAALDKSVKLGAKGEKVTFEKAMEVFKKEAGLDVPIRGKFPERLFADPKDPASRSTDTVELVSEGEELPIGAWFQLFEDHAVFYGSNPPRKYQFYVREYGILIATKDLAPPDALTVAQFWKQQPATPKKDGR
jgi:hypothetical protein